MGWKTFKNTFKIDHIVQIDGKFLHIGSSYVHDLVSVDLETGKVKENSTFSGFLAKNYPSLKDASSKEILEILKQEDTFSENLPVYTYDRSNIIESKCETYGYPNLTHEGKIMYENIYFKKRKDAVKAAQKNVKAELEFVDSRIKEMKKEIANYEERAQKLRLDRESLEEEISKK